MMIILHRKLSDNVAKNTQRVAVRMRCWWHLQGMVGVFGAMAATMVDLSEAFEQDLNDVTGQTWCNVSWFRIGGILLNSASNSG